MIVVGGESLVDLVPVRRVPECAVPVGAVSDRIESGEDFLAPRLGGGPYNTAIAAGRLGAPVAFLSRMSTDHFGQALRNRLTASHVDISMIQQGSEPTTLAVVALNEEKSADYTFYTQGTADRLFADPGPLPEETRILSLGTLGMVLEPGAGAYEHVLRRESARGTLTVVDPNIRAALIEDPEAYRARFDSWLKDIRLLKVSEDDARWLLGGEQDLAESDPDLTALAKSWLAKGVDAVVLTRGAAGLTVITDRETVSVPVPSPVPSSSVPSNSTPSSRALVDTIGAGDTVHGALLAWLHRHQVTSLRTLGSATLGSAQWRRILEYAAYAASITVSRSGAEPPTTKELEQRMAELA